MCPACAASMAVMVAGVVSTGGVAALVAKLRLRKRAKRLQQTDTKEEV